MCKTNVLITALNIAGGVMDCRPVLISNLRVHIMHMFIQIECYKNVHIPYSTLHFSGQNLNWSESSIHSARLNYSEINVCTYMLNTKGKAAFPCQMYTLFFISDTHTQCIS